MKVGYKVGETKKLYIVESCFSRDTTEKLRELLRGHKILSFVTKGRGCGIWIVDEIPEAVRKLKESQPYTIKIRELKSKDEFLDFLRSYRDILIKSEGNQVNIYLYRNAGAGRIIGVIKYLNKIDRSKRLWVLPYYSVTYDGTGWKIVHEGKRIINKTISSSEIKKIIEELGGKIIGTSTSSIYFYVSDINAFLGEFTKSGIIEVY